MSSETNHSTPLGMEAQKLSVNHTAGRQYDTYLCRIMIMMDGWMVILRSVTCMIVMAVKRAE